MARYADPTTKRVWARADRFTAGGNQRRYIVYHNTANTATADEEARNLANNPGSSSFHYVTDGVETIQCVHDYDSAWAVGAWKGAKAYIGNSESISIEVCSAGAEFTQAEADALRALVLHLMEYYSIPAERVVRHYDCHSGRKNCPAAYSGTRNAANDALHAYITGQTESLGAPSGADGADDQFGDRSWWGPKMAAEFIRQITGGKDDFLSGQPVGNKKYFWAVTGGVEYGTGGSDAVRALQQKLKAIGYDPDGIDGLYGHGCIEAHQSFLRDMGYYSGDVDGYHGNLTNEAMAAALEACVYGESWR